MYFSLAFLDFFELGKWRHYFLLGEKYKHGNSSAHEERAGIPTFGAEGRKDETSSSTGSHHATRVSNRVNIYMSLAIQERVPSFLDFKVHSSC